MKANIYIKSVFSFVILFVFHISARSQTLGNGVDGSPSISGIINEYTPLVAQSTGCSDYIRVEDASAFGLGDLILIIQMQGAEINNSNGSSYGSISNYNGAGNFEYARILAINNNTIYLNRPLVHTYRADGKAQVVKVPQYDSPTIVGTIMCKPWDGSTGGIIAFDALGTVFMNADIDVTGMGFRGGEVMNGPDYVSDISYAVETPSVVANAPKGEGIAFYGYGTYTSGRGAPANAGGGGNSHTAGGGGGSNGGAAGNGGYGYPADTFYLQTGGLGGKMLNTGPSQSRIFAGGGGGAGSAHGGDGTPGANGGGIVMITAGDIISNNRHIYACGDTAWSGTDTLHADGAGGGGGGGSVMLMINSITGTLNVDLRGGDGGQTAMVGGGPGGGGGGGTCRFRSATVPAGLNIDINGGRGGFAAGLYHGATDGAEGDTLFNQTLPISNITNSVTAGFDYKQISNTTVSFTNTSVGASSYFWDFGDGQSSTQVNPIHDYKNPGIFRIMLIAISAENCRDTAIVQFEAEVPNVFTPNQDGVNDYWTYSTGFLEGYSSDFQIYDRWGNLVYSGDSDPGWDGTHNGLKMPEGVYYYVVQILDENGKKTAMTGSLTLMR